MSNYANKLTSLAAKRQKLIEEEKKLVERRKKEIAALAEKFDLLVVSDALISGVFSELQNALKAKSAKLKEWETLGHRFLETTKPNSKTNPKNQKHAQQD